MIKFKDIREHELLDDTQRKVCEAMVRHAKDAKRPFDWLEYAKINLRGSAKNYAETGGGRTDRELQRAAVLFVFEALKACDIAIIKEWPDFDEMLKNLVYLLGELP